MVVVELVLTIEEKEYVEDELLDCFCFFFSRIGETLDLRK